MLNRFAAISILFGFAALAQSCIVIPVPSEKFLPEEKIEQLKIGSTTRDEVYETFGDRFFLDHGGSGVLYTQVRTVAWVATAYGGGSATDEENLYVEFDDQNILSHFELFEFDDEKACMATGTCIIRNKGTTHTNFIAFTRPPDEDQRAKQFIQAPGQCSVYIYGGLSAAHGQSGETWHPVCLGDQSIATTAILLSPALYLHWHLSPGTYWIIVHNAILRMIARLIWRDEEDWKTITKTLECKSGDMHFFRVAEQWETKGFFKTKTITTEISLELVDEEIGKANILDRDLASHTPASRLQRDAESYSLGPLLLDCNVSEK